MSTIPSGTSALLTWAVLALTVVVSVAGLAVDGFHSAERELEVVLRGGDVTTVLLAVPVTAAGLLMARRGSAVGRIVWAGGLAYLVYTIPYYVIAPTFTDGFLAYAILLAGLLVALPLALTEIDMVDIGRRFRPRTPARWVAGFMVLIAVALLWAWGGASLGFVASGEIPEEAFPAPEWRVRLAYTMDLVMVMPAALAIGVMLWQRQPRGFVLSSVFFVWMVLTQVNFVTTMIAVEQAELGESAGVAAAVGTLVVFAIPTVALLWRNPEAPSPEKSAKVSADASPRIGSSSPASG